MTAYRIECKSPRPVIVKWRRFLFWQTVKQEFAAIGEAMRFIESCKHHNRLRRLDEFGQAG
ncbi:hypothetical protein CN085_19770 [Sinorhizobium meliloti]|uniref:hypothetical protein n=1 Tax=Rhizobium meliloti TaxID=382 RepID=UPI000FD851D7|nr:hypothetical protein [Sinorhizobium meliloti]RVP13152.1 hypothetical protein CN085_19770 [Sinorhizobium meliloti]